MTLIPQTVPLALSGERFQVVYRIQGTPEECEARAKDICLEQTVEFPDDLVPDGPIRNCIVGRVESLEPIDDSACRATISFPTEAAADDLSQLLNVMMGNTSIKPGIVVEQLDLSPGLAGQFRGPRFGRSGLRDLLGVHDRPLLSTALKPMGLAPVDLGELAYRFALGGIDLIKDDHGLTNQTFCPFQDRVKHCAEAVARANRETGMRCLYVANITAPPEEMFRRARQAKAAGAGGLLVSPGLAGLDAVRAVADSDDIALPIMAHPAFQGSFVTHPAGGVSHRVIFGQIARLCGSDATIFPNYGGRFSFSRDECLAIAAGSEMPMGGIRPIFPVPAGGMSVSRVGELTAVYGREVIVLVGGGLFKAGPDLVENCRRLRESVRTMA